MKTKVAIYARYSSDLQNVRSIEDQIRVCRERSDREGWTIYECYTDYALSGATIARAGLQQMLRDARDGKVDIILVESLDRLSRDQADIATIFKHMQFAGVDIVTLCEGRVGVLDIGLRGTMNQLFLVETANKVRRGQRGRVERGFVASSLSYGYDVVKRFDANGTPARGERKVNEVQAQTIRRIFQEYADGLSPAEIAKRLNKDRVPSPFGMEWGRSTIAGDYRRSTGILNNEFYIGQILWNRHRYIPNPDTGKRVPRYNPRSLWVRQPAPQLRIVSQILWDRVKQRQQEQLQDRLCKPRIAEAQKRGKVHYRHHFPKHLLSGLLRCGCCGSGFVIRRHDDYGCASLENRGTCNNGLRVPRKILEDRVLTMLKVLLADDPVKCANFCEAYARRLKDVRTERAEEIKEFEEDLAGIEAEYDRLTDLPAKGQSDNPLLQNEIDSLIARHGLVTRALARLRNSADVLERHYRSHVDALVDTLSRHRRNQDSFQSFRALIGEVVLRPSENGTALIIDIKGSRPQSRHKPKMVREPPIPLKAGETTHTRAVYFGLNARYRGAPQ